MTRGELIKKYRKKSNLTQEQLAEKCNMATITIRQYENGKRIPQMEQLARIAIALNVSITDLWGDNCGGGFIFGKDATNLLAFVSEAIVHVKDGEVLSVNAVTESNNKTIERISKILSNISTLNEAGQRKVAEYTEDLASNSKYQHQSLPDESSDR